jgi:hypothetical protein
MFLAILLPEQRKTLSASKKMYASQSFPRTYAHKPHCAQHKQKNFRLFLLSYKSMIFKDVFFCGKFSHSLKAA